MCQFVTTQKQRNFFCFRESLISKISYLLAPTKTFTFTGPEVNMAARIPQPKITFTKVSSILGETIVTLLR